MIVLESYSDCRLEIYVPKVIESQSNRFLFFFQVNCEVVYVINDLTMTNGLNQSLNSCSAQVLLLILVSSTRQW